MLNPLPETTISQPSDTIIKSELYVKPELESVPIILEGSFMNSLSLMIKDKDKKNPKADIDSMDWEEED